MTDGKQQIISSIVQARDHLDFSLSELERLPAFDPSAVPFAAHALCNFLAVTEATVELLQVALTDDQDPQVKRLLEGLGHATRLMMHTANQLMNNAAIGELKFRFEKFDLPRLAQRACEYYHRLALRKNIQLVSYVTADVPLIWSDRVAVAAVMDNLLSNAVKYSPSGKTITVTVGMNNGDVVCSVKDEGPGISAQDQTRLFRRGVRLNNAPTGDEPSAGYGLAVARELIDQLGGAIWVDSDAGRGACFSFRLPAPQ